ncbi:gfo/Idh/MocA family oxidoreductase [bacterium]|nr:MAG: gfo/Idh/MocA family oxidoreductase [bacterium]
MNIGIIGAGLIGNKRAQSIKEIDKDIIVAIADTDKSKVLEFSKKYNCQGLDKWQKMVRINNIDAIVIAVPNKFVAPMAIAALKQRKHILCEKPFGRNSKESRKILETAKRFQRLVKVGFNHRFHPAILKAKKILEADGIGKIIFIRGRYGHGGRLGMEKEWRTNKDISGGGELLDQGVHIIDLCRYFGGEFKEVFGTVGTKFWKINVEDNAFVIMKNARITVQFQTSWTNWKNIFSLEIYGTDGFLQIEGLGGSYGKEKLIFGKRKKEFGVPIIKEYLFEQDISWQEEWKNFRNAILNKEEMNGDGTDGLIANQIVEAIYKSSKTKKNIRL